MLLIIETLFNPFSSLFVLVDGHHRSIALQIVESNNVGGSVQRLSHSGQCRWDFDDCSGGYVGANSIEVGVRGRSNHSTTKIETPFLEQ